MGGNLGSGGGFGGSVESWRIRFASGGASGDLRRIKEGHDFEFREDIEDKGLRDAGDEVADVFAPGERGQAVDIGHVAGFLGRVEAFALFDFTVRDFLFVGAMPGADAARDGGVIERATGGSRLWFLGR